VGILFSLWGGCDWKLIVTLSLLQPLDQKQLYLLLEHFVEGDLGSQLKGGRSE
jgi:hypothetical protein